MRGMRHARRPHDRAEFWRHGCGVDAILRPDGNAGVPQANRLREIAMAHPGEFGTPLLEVADQIVADAAALEVELIEAGFFPKPANQP